MQDKTPLRTQALNFLQGSLENKIESSKTMHKFEAFNQERSQNGKLLQQTHSYIHIVENQFQNRRYSQEKVSSQKSLIKVKSFQHRQSMFQRQILEEKAIDQILLKKGLIVDRKEQPQNLEVKFFNLKLNVHQKADNYKKLEAAKKIKLPHLKLFDVQKIKSLSPPPLGIYDPNYEIIKKKVYQDIIFTKINHKKQRSCQGIFESRYSSLENKEKRKGGRIYQEKLMNQLMTEILNEQKQLRLQLIQESCQLE